MKTREEAVREAFRAGFTALLETKDKDGNQLKPPQWVFNGFSIAHDLEPGAWAEWQKRLNDDAFDKLRAAPAQETER